MTFEDGQLLLNISNSRFHRNHIGQTLLHIDRFLFVLSEKQNEKKENENNASFFSLVFFSLFLFLLSFVLSLLLFVFPRKEKNSNEIEEKVNKIEKELLSFILSFRSLFLFVFFFSFCQILSFCLLLF